MTQFADVSDVVCAKQKASKMTLEVLVWASGYMAVSFTELVVTNKVLGQGMWSANIYLK